MRYFFLVFLVLFSCVGRNPLPLSDPHQSFKYEKIDHVVSQLMSELNIPGMAIGIVSKEKDLYMKGFGVRGVEDQLPVTPDTQFGIGSSTKSFTATALGILVDEGVVQWDAPIKSHYLPDFQLMDESATQLCSIRDLLTHQIGLPRHTDLMWLWYHGSLTREELYQRLRYLEPTAKFREKFQYNNLMYMTAGYLIGRVTNLSWEDTIKEKIFGPLGMSNSNSSIHDMQFASDFAHPHKKINGKIQQVPPMFLESHSMGPAGSINSSVRDLGKWLKFQLSRGKVDGRQIIEEKTLDEIYQPQIVESDNSTSGTPQECQGPSYYALGWTSEIHLCKKIIHHGGDTLGFTSFVGFLPEYDRGIAVLINANLSSVRSLMASVILDLIIKGKISDQNKNRIQNTIKKSAPHAHGPEEPLPSFLGPPRPMESYVGTYSHQAYGQVTVSMSEKPEALTIDYLSLIDSEAETLWYHQGSDSFFSGPSSGEAPFHFEFYDEAQALILNLNETDHIRFIKSSEPDDFQPKSQKNLTH